MERRDFLKLSLGSLLAINVLPEKLFADVSTTKSSNVKGVIFIVGDGFPLGVMKMMDEFMKRKFNEKSSLLKLMNEQKTKLVLQSTNSLSSVVTDSAPASVAWATGSKTVNRTLSILPDGRKLTTIFQLAKDKGMACGFVTTTRVTHATPAAWYSHNSNRDLEDDIAVDLLNSNLDVAMGGGDKYFNSKSRKDGRDLYKEFESRGYRVVKTKEELMTNSSTDSPILGVFSSSHINYFVDRINDKELGSKQPTLAEMTAVALKRLSKNPNGFILQIEAGRIDHACHANDAYAAMMDCYELDKTVATVLNFIERNPNVFLIITSDHGNSGFGINGTGPEYNDATQALLAYQNRASFEYMIKKMKNQDFKTVKDIFENYTQQKITDEEAESIYIALNTKRGLITYDIWYEPEATMGKILRASSYRLKYGKDSALLDLLKPPVLRRGNVGFTSTNHTAEDQLVIFYGRDLPKEGLKSRIDNTELFYLMAESLNIKYENPKMTEEEAKSYIRTVSLEEWKKHLELHIS